MMNLQNIKTPTLLLNKEIALNNIKFMVDKAKKHSLGFRPHFKTHQSAEIGQWFKTAGVDKITVSSVGMAKYFAQNGWKDVTIAFPVNIRELEDIETLAKDIKLNILISSLESVQFLAKELKQPLNYFIKIDAGYHRAGVKPENIKYIEQIHIAAQENDNLQFMGFLAHFGNTYHAGDQQEIMDIFEKGKQQLGELKKQFTHKYPDLIISVGDTPSCSLADDFTGIDEIRPGNFVFYDIMQLNLGVCNEKDIAVALACPIIDTYPERGEVLIYGGAVQLSKEYIIDKQGNKSFGKIVRLSENGWIATPDNIYLKSLSQEHGIIKAPNSFIKTLKVGDLLAVLLVHSCLTANLMKSYQTFDHSTIKMWDGV